MNAHTPRQYVDFHEPLPTHDRNWFRVQALIALISWVVVPALVLWAVHS